jgi:transketolase
MINLILPWLNLRHFMRNAFIDELVIAAEKNEKIVLIVGDLGYGVVEPFSRRYPKRFFNSGVAEQNLMGLAAGMASEGMHVFVYSIANFPTFRCAEQIRNDVDYHKLPVTIVVVGGGVAYGNLGYSHHAVQDYALMRVMPNMLIASPGDPFEVRACMRYLVNNPQPSYLRLGKAGEPNVHMAIPEVSPGKWLNIRNGLSKGTTFLTTGATLENINKLILERPKLKDFSLYSIPLWSMKAKQNQPHQIEQFQKVISIEDHLIDGGFGSWLLESTVSRSDLIGRIAIRSLDPRICGMVASQSTLNEQGGLASDLLLL